MISYQKYIMVGFITLTALKSEVSFAYRNNDANLFLSTCYATLTTTICDDSQNHRRSAEIQKLKAEAYQYLVTLEQSPILDQYLQKYEKEYLKEDSKAGDLSYEAKTRKFYKWLIGLEAQTKTE